MVGRQSDPLAETIKPQFPRCAIAVEVLNNGSRFPSMRLRSGASTREPGG